MAKKNPVPTARPVERAFLVGVEIRSDEQLLSLEDSLSELALLADTAGLDVVGQISQRMNAPNPRTYVGSGKVEEIKALAGEVKADVILFDNELSPRHLREFEKIFDNQARIVDRTALILDIFALHAGTREGALQVELAQYEYLLPRLTRAWTHLARQAGGGGGRAGSVGGVGLRGPGETQLEVDRRDIRRRIGHLKKEIEKVRVHRQQYRSRRKRSRIPVVALVGYTNAGKSTLINRIADAEVYVADQLFATLDPTTRRIELPGGQPALVTDTVGFIQKLPTELIAAFRATLEEIAEADLLLHLIDVTHPSAYAHSEAVLQTLHEIDADHIPILTVLNKIDLLPEPENVLEITSGFPNSVAVSALKGYGIPDLLGAVNQQLYENYTPLTVRLPYNEGGLIALFHDQGRIERVEQEHGGTLIKGRLPGRIVARYQDFIV